MTELHLAAMFGTPAICSHILGNGAPIDLFEDTYGTPLHGACALGRMNNIKVLLGRGAKVDKEDTAGRTALSYAACGGNIEVMEALLKAGADTEHEDKYGNTVLNQVATTTEASAARLLLSNGANANHVSANKTTALHKAIQENGLEMARALLENGARVDDEGPEGVLPLHFVVTSGQLAMAKLLCASGAHVNAPGSPRMPPIFWAVLNDQAEIAQFLLNSSAKTSFGITTAFHAAAMVNSLSLMKLFLNHASKSETGALAQVNQVGEKGKAPLHISAEQVDMDMVRILVEAGAEIDVEEGMPRTPLYFATANKKQDVREFLLNRGARSSLPLIRIVTVELEDGSTRELESQMVDGPQMADEELLSMLFKTFEEQGAFDLPIRQVRI